MLIKFIKPDFEFSDDRGSLKQLVHNGWKQVNYITSVEGSFRGDHYHKENQEAFFVISGEFELTLEHIKTHEKAHYTLKKGDFFIIYPEVMHSFLYKKDTSLISMYNYGVERPDGEKDIFTL
ncbi:cupin domain-containing protein [Candidatus Avelusimicrobium fimicolum]|uniref:polysaccharide biosynthesis C-terminal domain-containing protein n=1 Tax=Candidatus Avelusimicrobium fimicolum TaxID=3416216 RepID=UPI003D0F2B66